MAIFLVSLSLVHQHTRRTDAPLRPGVPSGKGLKGNFWSLVGQTYFLCHLISVSSLFFPSPCLSPNMTSYHTIDSRTSLPNERVIPLVQIIGLTWHLSCLDFYPIHGVLVRQCSCSGCYQHSIYCDAIYPNFVAPCSF